MSKIIFQEKIMEIPIQMIVQNYIIGDQHIGEKEIRKFIFNFV